MSYSPSQEQLDTLFAFIERANIKLKKVEAINRALREEEKKAPQPKRADKPRILGRDISASTKAAREAKAWIEAGNHLADWCRENNVTWSNILYWMETRLGFRYRIMRAGWTPTPKEIAKAQAMRAAGKYYRQIAEEFGVSVTSLREKVPFPGSAPVYRRKKHEGQKELIHP